MFSNASRVWGGNEKWTLKAAETLSSRGHSVAMAIREPAIWEGHARGTVEQIVLPFRNDMDIETIFALRKLIKQRKTDIFLPTRSRDYWIGGLANLFTGVPLVMRNGITRDLKKSLKERLRYGVFPDGIIVNAEAVKESLSRYSFVKREKIRVIYNGVDENRLSEELPPLKKSADEFLIVSAGRVETDKGFDVLVSACEIAAQQVPKLRCIIFGRGDEEEKLKRMILGKNLKQTVELGGFTTHLPAVLRQADLSVSSSYREGVSNLILESWSAACPIIATAIPGSAEIITDNVRGKLIPVGDAKQMAEAIIFAYQNPEQRKKWTQGGKQALQETFNWNIMAEMMEVFFQSLKGQQHPW